MKPQANGDGTQLSIAKLGVISAIAVAAIGVMGTLMNAYITSQTTKQVILIPIQATQTAQASAPMAVVVTSPYAVKISPTITPLAPSPTIPPPTATATNSPILIIQPTSASVPASPTLSPPTATATHSPAPIVHPTIQVLSPANLEQQLLKINIALSGTEADKARVRSYMTGPQSAYGLLAVSCIHVVGSRRLKQTGYLDVIDKWYTSLVGEQNYIAPDGALHLDMLKQAMVQEQNEIYGENMTSFEEILSP